MTTAASPRTQTAVANEAPAAEFPSSAESDLLERVVVRSMAPVELQSPADVARAMKDFDDEVFLSELMGEAIDAWFYEFTVQGKTIVGVSAQGAHEFARIRAEQGYPIRFPGDAVRLEEVTENGELGMRATVIARDGRTHQEGIGLAFYPHYETRKNGSRSFDKMAGRKALSVAERNAILRLIPESSILAVLKERKAVVAENTKRNESARAAAIANHRRNAPEPRRTVVSRGAQRAPSGDPYESNDVGASARRPRTKAGEFVLPFGRSKGTPLADLDEAAVRSALAWAEKNAKFAEFQTAARAYIAELEQPAGRDVESEAQLLDDDRELVEAEEGLELPLADA